MRLAGLWRHNEFRKLWAGHAISMVGSQMVFLALSLTAAIVLDATPIQMGVITAMNGLPALVFGLYLGAWSDRRRRRPILIASDIGRALLLLTIPVAYHFDLLGIGLLFAVSFGLGAMSLVFEVAFRSYLPLVVSRDELVDGNSKLELARSGAGVAGPSIGGALIQAVAAPFALIFGVVMFAMSAIMFRQLRVPEPDPKPNPQSAGQGAQTGIQSQSTFNDIKEGLTFIRGNSTLLGIAGSIATLSMFNAAFEAIAILYLVRNLDLNPGLIGVLWAVGSVGLIVGVAEAPRLSNRFGIGRILALGILVLAASDLVLPLIHGPTIVVFIALAIGEIFFGAGWVVFNVGQVSLRQAVTPDRLLGRMNSFMIVLSRSGEPQAAYSLVCSPSCSD